MLLKNHLVLWLTVTLSAQTALPCSAQLGQSELLTSIRGGSGGKFFKHGRCTHLDLGIPMPSGEQPELITPSLTDTMSMPAPATVPTGAMNGDTDKFGMNAMNSMSEMNSTNGYPNNVNSTNGYPNNVNSTNGYLNNVNSTNGYVNNMGGMSGYANNMNSTNGCVNNMGGMSGYVNNMGRMSGYANNMNSMNGYANNMGGMSGYANNMNSMNGCMNNMGCMNGYMNNMGAMSGYANDMNSTNGCVNNMGGMNSCMNGGSPHTAFDGVGTALAAASAIGLLRSVIGGGAQGELPAINPGFGSYPHGGTPTYNAADPAYRQLGGRGNTNKSRR